MTEARQPFSPQGEAEETVAHPRLACAIGDRPPLRDDHARPVLVFIRSGDGGIAEYAHAQANELANRGLRVLVLAPPSFFGAHPARRYSIAGRLMEVPGFVRARALRRLLFAAATVINPWVLAVHTLMRRPHFVLLDAFSELFGPLWAWPHRILAAFCGVRYATTLHDPVRQNSFGPDWWHRRSLRAAYAPLSVAVVHDPGAARAAELPGHIHVVAAPHGIFPVATERAGPDLRAECGIPALATVALSFGYIVDRKNLNLAIEALAQVPLLHLLIAGRQGSAADRPVTEYRKQAAALGVAARCHFLERFIPQEELGRFFEAADFLLMTYASSFVSQSGVLHIAANWDKPVLASGGPGPLVATVEEFGLGIVVSPDSVPSLVAGMDAMVQRRGAYSGAWARFREEASWTRNVDALLAAIDYCGGRGDT